MAGYQQRCSLVFSLIPDALDRLALPVEFGLIGIDLPLLLLVAYFLALELVPEQSACA
jgi:hypothetical protein